MPVLPHIETSQSICNANQLNGFYMMAILTCNMLNNQFGQYIPKSTSTIRIRTTSRISYPEMFLVKGALKICSKFIGEQSCLCVISIMLQNNSIDITLRHGCSLINLLHIFRTAFFKNISGWLLLHFLKYARMRVFSDLFFRV